jgi:SAM-dependent methyltransferase
MTGPPQIFDRRLRGLRLDRAAKGSGGADFLRRRVAEDLVERVESVERRFDLAVDLAATGGAFARALAASPAAAKVGALVEMAQSRSALAAATHLSLVGDEERLPFAEGAIDLAVSGLALHWINDLVGALIQIRRALRPDGLFLGAFLGGATLTELRQSLMAAEIDLTGGAGPRVSPFADAADGAALLQRAGYALPVADVDTIRVRYDDPLGLLRDLRAMGETSALVDRPARPLIRPLVARMREIYRQGHAAPDGRIVATFEILTLTGWAPHPEQPKPLRPGSAKMRLADALRSREIPAGDSADPTGRGGATD